MTISAIIRTKNSGRTVRSCLEHLLQQTQPVSEIIVVDSGSTDNTLEIVQQFGCTIVYYPTEEVFNYSKAINIGIAQSSADYILVLSSHFILNDSEILKTLFQFIHDNKRVGAASVFPPYGKEDGSNQKVVNIITKNNFKGFAMSNSCSLFRKELWEKYPFKENIPTVEDQEWAKHFITEFDMEFVQLKNCRVQYANPYHNIHKNIREALAIGRYVYPEYTSLGRAFRLFFYETPGAILQMDRQKCQYKVLLALAIFKEKMGVRQHLESIYNQKLQ